jgi:hypothetical protein
MEVSMRKRSLTLFYGTLVCLLLPVKAAFAADTIEPFVMPSARFAGMGGNHAAIGDDFYSLFTNPASFVDVKETFSAAEISLSAYGPVFELIDLFRDNDGLENLDISGIVSPAGFAAGFEMGGPLALGWVGKNLGLGIFNRIRSAAALSGTKIRPLVAGEILLVGGYSFRFINNGSHVLDGGFLGKGFFRGAVDLEAPIFEVDKLVDNPEDKPFGTYLGLGFDLGLRYTFRKNLTAALVCYDMFSPVLVIPYDHLSDFGDAAGDNSYASVRRRLDIGVAYRVSTPLLDRYITRLMLLTDYHDILGFLDLVPRNPILNVGLGVELTLLNILRFRLGIAEALPAFGIGLDLSFMTVDLAIRGKELGLDPGFQPVYCLDLGLLFRY